MNSPDKFKKFYKYAFFIASIAIVGIYLVYVSMNEPLIDAHQRKLSSEDAIKKNPSVSTSSDTTPKNNTSESDSPNTPPALPASSVSSKTLETTPSTTGQNTEQKAAVPNAAVMHTLEEGLARELGNRAFTPYEAEIIIKEIKNGIYTGERFSLNRAQEIATERLSLSPERVLLMEKALSLAMDDTGGAYPLVTWESCLEKRIERFKPNDCEQDLISTLKAWAQANAEHDRITNAVREKFSPLGDILLRKSVKVCGRDFESAAKLFSIYLANCN